MLKRKSDLTITELEKHLKTNVLGKSAALFCTIGSTNTYAKEVSSFFPSGFVTISREQTFGRGRQGKRFLSPKDKGLYMSILLKQSTPVSETNLTVKACIAVCHAVEKETGVGDVRIKWVNDLYYQDKKFCGILAESKICGEEKSTVLGIGINITTDKYDYDSEYADRACSLSDFTENEINTARLAANILNEMERILSEPDSLAIIGEYRERSMLIGKDIYILEGDKKTEAVAVGIDDSAALLVEYPDGKTGRLTFGDVSIRLMRS